MARCAANSTRVLWASEGRSDASRARAEAAGFEDAGTLAELCRRADILLSICPPDAAVEIARQVASHSFAGVYVEANAIAPATCREIAEVVEPTARLVDGGIIGAPPDDDGTTSFYLAGSEGRTISGLFAGGPVEAKLLDAGPPAASALKMAYAGWTKGSSALLLAIRALAVAEGVEADLLAEWASRHPGLLERMSKMASPMGSKAWRWVGEMDQIAIAFEASGLPGEFHRGAAEIYRRVQQHDQEGLDATIGDLVADLLDEDAAGGARPSPEVG